MLIAWRRLFGLVTISMKYGSLVMQGFRWQHSFSKGTFVSMHWKWVEGGVEVIGAREQKLTRRHSHHDGSWPAGVISALSFKRSHFISESRKPWIIGWETWVKKLAISKWRRHRNVSTIDCASAAFGPVSPKIVCSSCTILPRIASGSAMPSRSST